MAVTCRKKVPGSTLYKAPLIGILAVLVCLSSSVEGRWRGWSKDKELDWWQDTIIYQIYPSSFMDSDGDGVGDLKGITMKLDHFKDAGVGSFWLSPIFQSPMADLGYDISNFTAIDSSFGTMEDFQELVKGARARNLRILMDFVPNHSSDEHPWFQKSIKKIDPYTDYYIWKKGTKKPDGNYTEPNNWLSLFGGSGWTFVEERGEFYYHQFNKKQPDFNFRNQKVKDEMLGVLKFWLDQGVDGFRMDAVKHLMEDASFADESWIDPEGSKEDYMNMYHNLTTDWPETYDLIYEWRKFLDSYMHNASSKHTRVMLTEAYTSVPRLMEYYGNATHPGAHSPFNFFLMYLNFESNATVYDRLIRGWTDNQPDDSWPNWVIGNHDNSRVATRLGENAVDGFHMLSMLLPGTSVTYQGEEIGQPNTLIRKDQIKDPNNNGHGVVDVRDPQRGPYLWDTSENAGFTTKKKPWEPINPSYWKLNLEAQKAVNHTHYKVYQDLAKLRKHPTIQRGTLNTYVVSTWVFAFARHLTGSDSMYVVLNIGSEREIIILTEEIPSLPETLEIIIPSINSGYKAGDIVHTGAVVGSNSNLLILRPKSGVVLRGKPKDPGTSTQGPSDPTGSTPGSGSANSSALAISTISRPLLLLGAALPLLLAGGR